MSIVSLKAEETAQGLHGATHGSTMDRRIEKPKWKKHLPAGIGGGAVLIAVVLYFAFAPASGRTMRVENSNVTVSTATRAAFEDFIPVRGRVTPLMTVYLDAIEGGRVEKVYVEDGAELKAGDPIVDLSNTALQLDVIAREAEVTEQLNNLRTIELTLERDRLQHQRDLVEIDYQIVRLGRQLERRQALSKNGNVSEAELQNTADEHAYYIKKRAVVLDSQKTNARLQAEQMVQLKEATVALERNLEFARRNLDSLKVRAPSDGKLTAFTAKVGQSLSPGTRVGQIDDPSSYKVLAEIDEFYLGRVDIGQTASIAAGGRTYDLKVAKVYPQVHDGKFDVDLVFDTTTPSDIRRGQTVQTKLTLGDTTEALLIPDGAFYQDTGGNWVFVVSPDGEQAVRRNVRMGRRNARFIEVLDGLEPGEQVITSPYSAFLDKDRLNLTP